MGPHLHLICDSTAHVDCKLKNIFGTGMCEFGPRGAFYRRSLTLVCVFMFKCDCQGLCNDVFNGVARKMQRLVAIAAALCAVTVPSHRQKGWGQHAQITLCEFGPRGAFYRRSLTLGLVYTSEAAGHGLCNDVFNGVARKMQRLVAIAAALCAVMVSSHRQKGWGHRAQITLRHAESFFNPQPCPENLPRPS